MIRNNMKKLLVAGLLLGAASGAYAEGFTLDFSSITDTASPIMQAAATAGVALFGIIVAIKVAKKAYSRIAG